MTTTQTTTTATNTAPIYVAITVGAWGKGPTPDLAKAAAFAAGAKKGTARKHGWQVQRMPDGTTDAGLNGDGVLVWTRDPSLPRAMPETVETWR